MSDVISPETFAYLVALAALELEPDEAEYLRGQLNLQLKAIHELDRAAHELGDNPDADGHGVPYPPSRRLQLRADVPVGSPLAAALLAGGPETEDGYFVVPDNPNQEL
jgi:Asp-tRNA(Asn)/Glu-tRNA(Gln) amidotransferase C subunit